MTWRVAVTHTTEYRYDQPVRSSYNEARLEPRSDRHQTVLSSRVEVLPQVRIGRHVDYWGSVVHHFDLQVPHTTLAVVGRAVVETATSPLPTGDITWDDLRTDEVADRFFELLAPTAVATPDAKVHAVAAELARVAKTPRDAVDLAAMWVNDHLTYERGFTEVYSTVGEVLRTGRGVCQDFAHVMLALLRSMGIPGWYVSGYLHPLEDAAVGDTVVGESHAWVAAWVGDIVPVDPTSLTPVADRHVRVAAGRDYADVPPFRGVYAGHGAQHLEVQVEIARLA